MNITKDGFPFAAAAQVPRLMRDAQRGVLARYTPCKAAADDEIAEALAVVHAELILIHPFREGNGRVLRLLALLMGFQAGLPPLDFSPLAGRGLKRYVAGIHAATGRDYRVLIGLFRKVIDRTWRNASSSGR